MLCFHKALGMFLIAVVSMCSIALIASQDAEVGPPAEEGNASDVEAQLRCGETSSPCGPGFPRCCNKWYCNGWCVPENAKPPQYQYLLSSPAPGFAELALAPPPGECTNYCGGHLCRCSKTLPSCCLYYECFGVCRLIDE